MIRAAVGLVWSAWGGHAALVAGVLMALQVHATYRVPAVVFVTLLPWVGMVIAITTILMLTVNLLPKSPRGRERAREVDLRTAAVLVVVRSLYRVALIGCAAFLLWTAVVFVNGALDRSTDVQQPSEVLSVVVASIDPGFGKLIPHGHVDLRSWESGGGVERVVLPAHERQRTWIGQPVNVTVRAGFLGIPWVAAVNLDEARHLRQVLTASPRALHAMQRLITLAVERQQWTEALELTRRYAAAYPDDVAFVEYVAGYLGVAGRYSDQVELIEGLVARSPDYESLSMLGFALDRSEDHQRAIEVLKRAVELRPEVFVALHYLGEAYQALGRRDEAIAAYEAELRVRPQSLEVRRRVRALRNAAAPAAD
ncbi:MAG TPA: tetratricopeptide repeat protein [Methylomirabilota bacterium]|jgi:hypothetical protein